MSLNAIDYDRIERAIRYIDDHRLDQPALAEVAAHVGLSEHHFQRLFRRWAGVSPKRFLQYLTADHAKRLLRKGASVLEASYETGLSGPARLHDLLVNVEAMTPGEYKEAGAGLKICYGYHPTPFGEALVAVTERGVCGLAFTAPRGREHELAGLHRRWPRSTFVPDAEATGEVIRKIFAPRASHDAIHLLIRGTNFQLRVWEALLRVPPGAATTYGDLATAVGSPGAARAVGVAVGSNPIGYLIPCHRVLRQTGAFGGYRWGEARKRAILGWEAARQVDTSDAALR